MLITNAPRPGEVVTRFLDKVGVPRNAYDGIVSSGDVTRAVMAARPQKAVFHIGPERDLPIFDGLGLRFVPLEQADYVVCTGLAQRRGRDAGNLPRRAWRAAPPPDVHAVRQSGPGGRARRAS